MALEIVPLEARHVWQIKPQPEQEAIVDDVALNGAAHLLGPYSFAAVNGDEVIMCGGLMQIWDGRYILWSILSSDAGKYMIKLHRATRRAFGLVAWRRLELYVAIGHDAGCRWANMLGFLPEGRMARFFPNGEDALLYARVR